MEGPAFKPVRDGSTSGTLVLPSGVCGPPDSANGGVVAGLMAASLPAPVEVTLRRPVPLDQPIAYERIGDAIILRDGLEILAIAQPGVDLASPPPAPSWAEALEASALRPAPEFHPFPTCFVCGPAREPDEGLRLQMGPLPRGDGVAAPWIPPSCTAGADGRVRDEILWAVLDCPGGYAVLRGRRPRPLMLARITARVLSHVRPGDPCVVLGWHTASEGARHHVGTALYDVHGRAVAVARAVWVET